MFEKGALLLSFVISAIGSKTDLPTLPGDGYVASGVGNAESTLKGRSLIQYLEFHWSSRSFPGRFSVSLYHVLWPRTEVTRFISL